MEPRHRGEQGAPGVEGGDEIRRRDLPPALGRRPQGRLDEAALVLGDSPQHAPGPDEPDAVEGVDRVGEARIGLLHGGAEIREGLGRRLGQPRHLGVDAGGVAEARAPGDPQAPHPVLEAGEVVRRFGERGRHVAEIGTTDRLHHQGGIAHAPGHRAEMRHRPERRGREGRHPAEAGFQPVDAAEGRRDADRAGPVGADMQEPEVERRRRGGPGRGAAGGLLRVPGVAGRAGMGRVAEPLPAEFRHRGLGERDGAGLDQAVDDRGVLGRRSVRGGERAAPHRMAGPGDVVLDREGEAVEGAAGLALGPARRGGGGRRQGAVAVDEHEGVEVRSVAVDAVEGVGHHLPGRQGAVAVGVQRGGAVEVADLGHRISLRSRHAAG